LYGRSILCNTTSIVWQWYFVPWLQFSINSHRKTFIPLTTLIQTLRITPDVTSHHWISAYWKQYLTLNDYGLFQLHFCRIVGYIDCITSMNYYISKYIVIVSTFYNCRTHNVNDCSENASVFINKKATTTFSQSEK